MPTVSCAPSDIAKAAACFQGIPEGDRAAAEIFLLNSISGLNLTPAQLAQNAKCYCFDPKTAESVKIYLLCAIANAAPA